MAAGIAQVQDNKKIELGAAQRCLDSLGYLGCLPSLDDPYDQAAIKTGIELWDTFETRLHGNHLIHELRAKRNLLNTQPIRVNR